MWVVFIIILIILAICSAFWRLIWAITKPIFVFLYHSIVNALKSTGLSEEAAKAIISAVAIIIIILILLISFN